MRKSTHCLIYYLSKIKDGRELELDEELSREKKNRESNSLDCLFWCGVWLIDFSSSIWEGIKFRGVKYDHRLAILVCIGYPCFGKKCF